MSAAELNTAFHKVNDRRSRLWTLKIRAFNTDVRTYRRLRRMMKVNEIVLDIIIGEERTRHIANMYREIGRAFGEFYQQFEQARNS